MISVYSLQNDTENQNEKYVYTENHAKLERKYQWTEHTYNYTVKTVVLNLTPLVSIEDHTTGVKFNTIVFAV